MVGERTNVTGSKKFGPARAALEDYEGAGRRRPRSGLSAGRTSSISIWTRVLLDGEKSDRQPSADLIPPRMNFA